MNFKRRNLSMAMNHYIITRWANGSFPLLSIIRYSTLVTMRWLALVGVLALFYCPLISNITHRFLGSSSPQPTNFPFQSLAIIDHLLDGQSVQVGAGTPLSLTDIMFQKIPLLL